MQPVNSDDPTVPLRSEHAPGPGVPYHNPYDNGQPIYPSEPARPSQPYAPRQRYGAPTPNPVYRGYRASQIVYLILGIIEVLLVIRFVLELLAANPSAAFTSLIYGITDPLVSPFEGVFPNSFHHGNVFDLAAILAIIVYALLAWVIDRVIQIILRRQPPA